MFLVKTLCSLCIRLCSKRVFTGFTFVWISFCLCAGLGYAQTGLTLQEKFNEASRLYYLHELEQAGNFFRDISDRLCNSETYIEECIQTKIFKARIIRFERDFESAELLLSEANSIAKEYLSENHPIFVKLYVHYSYFNDDMSELEEAKRWADRAIEMTEVYDLTGIPRAEAYIGLGVNEDTHGNYHNAVDAYIEALRTVEGLERDLELSRLLSQAHNNLGISYRRLGKTDLAMSHYQLAWQVVMEAFGEDHWDLALLYNSMGSIYYDTGDFRAAADYFLRASQIFITHHGENDNRVAIAFSNAGVSYSRVEDLDNAVLYLERAQRIKESVLGTEHLDTAIGYANLAYIYMKNEETDAALNNYQISLKIRQRIFEDDHPTLVNPNIQLGILYIQKEEYSTAREYLYEALHIASTRLGETHPDVLQVYTLIGDSWTKENNLELADSFYVKTLSLLVGEGEDFECGQDVNLHAVSNSLRLIETAKARGDLKQKLFGQRERNPAYLVEALSCYELACDTIDQLQTQYQSEASKLDLIGGNYSIYTHAIDAMFRLYEESSDDAWLDQMFLFAEKSRARIALELLQETDARAFGGVPGQVLDHERELNARVTRLTRQFHLEREKGLEADPESIRQYRDSLFYARRDLVHFTEELEGNYPSYYTLKYDQNLIDRQQLSHLLNEDETVISYIVGEENIVALLIDKHGISAHRLGEIKGLPEQIGSIRSAVTGGKTDQYKADAWSLWKKLVEPLVPAIRTSSLIILPDQMLHHLPFEMLLTDASEGLMYHQLPYLIRKYQIQYAPSATMLQRMHRQRPERPRNLLAMAPFHQSAPEIEGAGTDMVRYGLPMTPLPLTLYEIQEIANLFNKKRSVRDYFFPEKTEILAGPEATKNRLENKTLREYGTIHFATHAFANESNPSLSGIVLQSGSGGNGIVYLGDIYNLEMNADMVVLGACETGMGSIYRGEGLIGLTRAFIHAGASNLVVSMWRVNDQSTARLMIHFYQHIREGDSYGMALQKAKLLLIDQPEMAAPRNWAAFVLNGR